MSQRSRLVQFRCSEELLKIFKKWCVDNDTSITAVCEQALVEFLKSKGVEIPDSAYEKNES